jgi:hypothetical protein
MIKFINGIFSTGTPESSKRVFGAIGFICSIIYIGIWGHDLIPQLLYVSASLLGIETISNIFTKK